MPKNIIFSALVFNIQFSLIFRYYFSIFFSCTSPLYDSYQTLFFYRHFSLRKFCDVSQSSYCVCSNSNIFSIQILVHYLLLPTSRYQTLKLITYDSSSFSSSDCHQTLRRTFFIILSSGSLRTCSKYLILCSNSLI